MKAVKYLIPMIVLVLILGILSSCGRLDKSELEALLTQEHDPARYTDASYQNYLRCYREAMDVYQSSGTTSFRIETVTVNLMEAINDLVPIADFTKLHAELAEEINPMAYTNASYQVYKAVYDSAVIIASDELSKQSVVNNAVRNLITAKKALVPKTDTSELGELLRTEYPEKHYTRSSYASYRAAYDAAQALMADDSATETDVRLAINGLQQSIDRLVLLGDDKELIELLDQLKKTYFTDNGADITADKRYTPATMHTLESVYNMAKGVCDEKDASQVQIDAMIAQLNDAVEALVDKITLYDAILRMDSYLPLQNKYTSASFDHYLYTVTLGMILDSEYDPSVSDIEEAVNRILNAEKALMRRPISPSGKTDFDLSSMWIVCYENSVLVGDYFTDYAEFYNMVFDSFSMIEQSGPANFRLRDGYSVSILPDYLVFTDVSRTTDETYVSVMGITFEVDEYAVGELLGAPTEYISKNNIATLVYVDANSGVRCEFNFSAGTMDSIILSRIIDGN
ncbi:MAG: hypothetical protein E7616_08560 [Ruminococcaceae bacterium]|nr:hypothetical protein [Oscillospiraceae bacterium]